MSETATTPTFDPTKPIVELKGKRICPERFATVRFVRTDQDRHGPYEIWQCTAVRKNKGHAHCEDPAHNRVMDGRATRTGPCSDTSHVDRVGRYIVRESHYRRAFQRRGADQRCRARREAKESA